MSITSVLHVLGRLCLVFAALLLLPLLVVALDGGAAPGVVRSFLLSAAFSGVAGLTLMLTFASEAEEFDAEEAFAVVSFSWIVFMLLGALPFVLSGKVPGMLDACFETMSGFTTTGASVISDPAALGRPLLFWRALTQWIGGVGIVALSVAILPTLGAGGNYLYRAEVAGPIKAKLAPRIADVARLLWGIYLGLTLAETVSLWAAGMSWFDALCHSFATVATGGFGTRADSLASFPPAVQWVTVVFMVLSGLNLVLLLAAVRGHPGELFRSTEVRVWLWILALSTGLSVAVLARQAGGIDEQIVREAAFTVVSVCSTTGFVTADFALWPVALHVLLLLLMVSGACTGSTSGSAKVFRHVMWAKASWRELQRLLRPNGVFVVKVDGREVPDRIVHRSVSFLLFYLTFACAGALVLALLGMDGAASIGSVITCLANTGPGLGSTGPTSNFAAVPDLGKALLIACMMLGRLEFYAVLVLLSPLAWKR